VKQSKYYFNKELEKWFFVIIISLIILQNERINGLRNSYLFNEVKVTWIDLELRWIFRIASTIWVDVSTETIDDVEATDPGDDVICEPPPQVDEAEDMEGWGDERMGLLWRYVMHSGSHHACKSFHHSLTGLVLTTLKKLIKKFIKKMNLITLNVISISCNKFNY